MNGSTETRFLYEGDQIIGEYNGSNQLLRRYVPGAEPGEVAAWYEGAGASDRRYLVTDRQGSVISVTNASGTVLAINSYDEAGIGAAGNLGRFQYGGEPWLSEVGLYNLQARAYSPYMGRFMQTDPIQYDGGANWYAYGDDDPVNKGDPSGLQTVGEIIVQGVRTPFCDDFCMSIQRAAASRAFFDGLQTVGTRVGAAAGAIFGGVIVDLAIPTNAGQHVCDTYSPSCHNMKSEEAQPDERDLAKIKGNKQADEVAVDHGYKGAEDAKKGLGGSRVNIYKDKRGGGYWIWDGKPRSEKQPL